MRGNTSDNNQAWNIKNSGKSKLELMSEFLFEYVVWNTDQTMSRIFAVYANNYHF